MPVWKAMLMPEGMECGEEWSPPVEEIVEGSVPEEPSWSLCLVKSAIVRIVCLEMQLPPEAYMKMECPSFLPSLSFN